MLVMGSVEPRRHRAREYVAAVDAARCRVPVPLTLPRLGWRWCERRCRKIARRTMSPMMEGTRWPTTALLATAVAMVGGAAVIVVPGKTNQ